MGLFRRRTTAPPQPTSPPEPPPSLWRDAFGRLATRGVQIIVVLLVAIAIIWGMREVSVVVIPVILALIFASAFSPFMGWLRDRGLPSIAATIVALLSIVAVLTGLIWLIVWQVSSQWETLAKKAVEGYDVLVKWAQQLDLPIVIDQQQLDEWIEAAKDFLFSAQFGSGAIAGISAVASFVTGFVLMVVILFFFLRDGKKIWEFLIRPFRGEQDARARRIGNKTVDTLGAYVRGTAAVAAVDAIGIGIGLLICQVPLAIPLAVLVFILAFIPIVGATLAGILAALVALVAQGPIIALIVVAIVIGVNQLEGNFLQPVLMGRTLKLHSLVILVALAIGTVLGGVLGAVLAVPITAVAWGIVQVWDGDNLPARWARKKPEVEASV